MVQWLRVLLPKVLWRVLELYQQTYIFFAVLLEGRPVSRRSQAGASFVQRNKSRGRESSRTGRTETRLHFLRTFLQSSLVCLSPAFISCVLFVSCSVSLCTIHLHSKVLAVQISLILLSFHSRAHHAQAARPPHSDAYQQ